MLFLMKDKLGMNLLQTALLHNAKHMFITLLNYALKLGESSSVILTSKDNV